jgi:hypothetical protein
METLGFVDSYAKLQPNFVGLGWLDSSGEGGG